MTMKWELDSVLEQSLTQIAAGKARVESCLLTYPAMADELEPLLRTAETLRSMPKPVLAPDARARIEGQVLAAVAGNPRLAPARRPRPRLALPAWRVPRWAVTALTLLLALIVALTTTVGASADALPGSALYPVKLATEDAWLWLTPARGEPRVHLQLARRRLAEIEALAAEDRFEEAVFADMADHLEAALAGAADLPPALALPLLDELAVFLVEQQQTLSGLLVEVPAASRGTVADALLESASLIERTESLRTLFKANGTPGAPLPAGSYTPTSPPGMTGVEGAAETPAATEGGAANATPILGATATATATPDLTATAAATQQAGPAPSSTEPAAMGAGTTSKATDTPTPSGPPAWGVTREPGEPTVPAKGLLKTPGPPPKDDDSDPKDKGKP